LLMTFNAGIIASGATRSVIAMESSEGVSWSGPQQTLQGPRTHKLWDAQYPSGAQVSKAGGP
jgi:hypothetical protein